MTFVDYLGRSVRLTQEREAHIFEHPEMANQMHRVQETLQKPELVVATLADETVQVYHRYYTQTPVTSKHLLVAVKQVKNDAFVLTAFFSNRRKRGRVLWQR